MSYIIQSINKAISLDNGREIAKFYDIYFLAEKKHTISEVSEDNVKMIKSEIWRDSMNFIFQIPKSPSLQEFSSLYIQAILPLIRNFSTITIGISVPILKTIAKGLKYFGSNVNYNDSVSTLKKMLPIALKSQSSKNPNVNWIYVVNELLSLNLMRNQYKDAEMLLKSIQKLSDDAACLKGCPLDQLACHYFLVGRVKVVSCQINESREFLLKSFHHIPPTSIANRRLVLAYLIPVQLSFGEIPSEELIMKYNLGMFVDIINSVKWGDINLFENAFTKNQILFIKLGIFDLLMKIRNIIILRILTIVHDHVFDNTIPITIFQAALSIHREYSLSEATSIAATLIYEKLINGYIDQSAHEIKLKANDPFPILTN